MSRGGEQQESAERAALLAVLRMLRDEVAAGSENVGDFSSDYSDHLDAQAEQPFATPFHEAVFDFCEDFCDQWNHGFPQLNGSSWRDAIILLSDVIRSLEKGEVLADSRMRRYYPTAKSRPGCLFFAFNLLATRQ